MIDMENISIVSGSPTIAALKVVALENGKAGFTPAKWCKFSSFFGSLGNEVMGFFFKVSPGDKAAVIRAVPFIEAAFKLFTAPIAVVLIKHGVFRVRLSVFKAGFLLGYRDMSWFYLIRIYELFRISFKRGRFFFWGCMLNSKVTGSTKFTKRCAAHVCASF